MIVCVEGTVETPGNRKPDGEPGFDLIQDPVVAYACGVAFHSPSMAEAEALLKKLLDPEKYVVGHGGSHIFVAENIGPKECGRRLAMLVDSNDSTIRFSFPALPGWKWPLP